MPRPRRVSARSRAKPPAAEVIDQKEPEETPTTPLPAEEVSKETSEETNMEVEPANEPSEPAKEEESAPEVEQEPDDEAMLTDKSYLINISLGYVPEENLKRPLKGFTQEDEVQLFPVIDSMSSKLFTIVQKMTETQKKAIEAAMKRRKGILKICNFPKAYLYHVNYLEQPSESEKNKSSKRTPHPFLLTEDENIFSEDKLKLLRAVLDAGWKREVVMRSPGSTGRKTGDVYYYSPEGTKFRSSKQVAQHLTTLAATPFTIENFSFAKVRISTNPDQEIVRKAYDGKSPPRPPPKPATVSKSKPPPQNKAESSKTPKASTSKEIEVDARSIPEEPIVKGVSSRRSIQPPKRYSGDAVLLLSKRSKMSEEKQRNSNANKGLMQMGMLPPKYPKGMEDSSSNLSETMDFNHDNVSQNDGSGTNSVAMKELVEDSLFQISALRQSGGIDVDKMHQYVESQKKLAQKVVDQAGMGETKPRAAAGRSKRGEIIPCSIRCPGMTGEVPNLQCTRCLCLYHAECLGLPLNLNYPNFLCSNCEGGPSSSSSAATAAAGINPQEMKKTMLIRKPGEMKRPPPPLVPAGKLPRGPPPRKDVMVALASKESLSRVPHRLAVPSAVGIGRGMVRGRGMSAPHIRSPAQMHAGQRMIPPDVSQVHIISTGANMIKRGRGRPPARGLPQLNNKSLTITHLPRVLPKPGGPPPVPNLQPMSSPKGIPAKLPLPVLPVKPRQAIPTVPNLMKPNSFKLTVPPPSLSGRTFKKVPVPTQQIASNLKLSSPMVNKPPPAMYAQPQDKPRTKKRYPQSFVTIAGKKFVLLPRKKSEFGPTTTVVAVGNGVSPKINYTGESARQEIVKKVEVASTVVEQNNGSDSMSLQPSTVKDEANKGAMAETTDEIQNSRDNSVCSEDASSIKEGDEPEVEDSVKVNTDATSSSTEVVSVSNQ